MRKRIFIFIGGRHILFSRLNVVLLCLTVVLSTQCSPGKRPQHPESRIIVSCPGDERIFFQEDNEDSATYLMFLSLQHYDELGTGEPQPELAERWEHSKDYKEWTYFLRSDVKWHDGVQMTAHDIKFTMDLRKQLDLMPDNFSVETLDDFTIKIIYTEPNNGNNSWSVYYPKHLLEDLDPNEFWEWDFWKHPVGNGPYRYLRHVPKTMIEVEANPDYFRGKPKIERVVLKFAQEASFPELLSGEVDAFCQVGQDFLPQLKGDDRFRTYYWWGYFRHAIYWNHRNPLFQSPEIRRALTMAINRNELHSLLNMPEGVPIMDTIQSMRQFQLGLYPEPLQYDPEKAIKLFNKNGWRDTDGDGILDRDGEDFSFTLLTTTTHTGIYIKDQLRRIGVNMEIQTLAWVILRARKESGNFDALSWIFGSKEDGFFNHSSILGEDSSTGYSNPEMIRLLSLAKDTMDLDERDRIYREIMPIFIEDMPVTFLFQVIFAAVAHRRIKGLKSPLKSDFIMNLENLWIEEED